MLTASALTDIGKQRELNQDSVFMSVDPIGVIPSLFIIADGMGSHRAGGFASSYLINSVINFIRRSKSENIRRVIRNALQFANAMILEKSHRDPKLSGIGTTCVCCVVSGGQLITANVGDSRLYLVHDGIHQITVDHSYVEEMVSEGLMIRDSEEYRSKKNLITRAVGFEDELAVDFFECDLSDGDYILLCSDGLTNMLDDDAIYSIVSGSGSIAYKTKKLIDTANDNGGSDNIAVILVKYSADGADNV